MRPHPLRALAAVLLVSTTALLPTHPAEARLPAGITVVETSDRDATAEKVVKARCPDTHRVVDVSAWIDGSSSVALTAVRPDDGMTRGYARARDVSGARVAWSVSVAARCVHGADPERAEVTVPVTGGAVGTEHTAVANCAAGARLLGTGFDVAGDAVPHTVVPHRAAFLVPYRGALVTAAATTTEDHSLTAIAICERAPVGTARAAFGLPIVLRVESDDVSWTATAGPCPAGTHVTGGGGEVMSGDGGSALSSVVIDPAADTVTVDGTDHIFCCAYGTVVAYAICS